MLKRGIVFAMESEESSAAMANVSDMAVTSDIVDDVEAPVSEVEQLVESTDSAHNDVEALDKINDVMAESVESGEGLDPTAAQIAEIAVESIRARVGIIGDDKMPAMEAFGAKGSRVAATKLAMESIGDSMQKVWRAIKAAFKKVWAMIKDLYKKFFDGATKLKAAAESSLKRAQTAHGTAENDDIELPTVYAAFVEGDKFDETKIAGILDNHIKVTEAAKYIPSSLKTVIDAVKKEASSNSTAVGALASVAITTMVEKGSNLAIDKNVQDFFGTTDSSDEVFRSHRMAFNRAIYYVDRKVGTDYRSVTYSFSAFDLKEIDNTQDDIKISVLDRSRMAQIANRVKDLADITIKFNTESKKINDIDKQADTVFSMMEKKQKSERSESNAAPVQKTLDKEIAQALRDIIKTTASIVAGLPRDNIRTGRVALDYVNASIAEYKNA